MSRRRSEFVKTLEAGVFALSLISLYFVQSVSLFPEQSSAATGKRASIETLIP